MLAFSHETLVLFLNSILKAARLVYNVSRTSGKFLYFYLYGWGQTKILNSNIS